MLEKINTPQDLRRLPLERLPILAQEIRQRMIEVVSKTGGHLASSLGTVELTIALHYCLDTPQDKVIWDVGHQTYAHKILTGRNKNFDSLRQLNGLSGFPCKDESEYDIFNTGHSSTAVSLALGLACGRDLLPQDKYFKVVAVIGDGSLSGGLCLEGLNNAGHLKRDLIVILNTNELSIAPNVGALSTYLNKLISLPLYNRFRDALQNFVSSRIPKGTRLLQIANKFEEGLKSIFIPGMLFEELGFRYFGPFDGHQLDTLIPTFKKIFAIKGPLLIHVVTKKGKGFAPAEKNPVLFHSAPAFDKTTGQPLSRGEGKSYTGVFSDAIIRLAQKDARIVAITAAMPEGTGLDRFRDVFPTRFFDVGIAEEHAVCFAAGLARKGLKPVVAIYSTFLQRSYDQIIECVSLQRLGVVFALDRAGVVPADGPTHQGIFDLAMLRTVPDMILMAPADGQELAGMLELALSWDVPVAIRYPKAKIPSFNFSQAKIELGRPQVLLEGRDFVIIALGSMVLPCYEAMEILKKDGYVGTLVNARFVKPLDKDCYQKIISGARLVVTVEDGILEGGFGSALMELLQLPILRLGLPSEFIPCGPRELLLEKYGLSAQVIAKKIKNSL